MREILFRGYNNIQNKWYYGMLDKFDNKYLINDGLGIKSYVEEDSIGQYTGFEDKSGKKIFEGDIINVYSENEYGWEHIDENWFIEFYDGAFQRTNGIGILYNICEICNSLQYEIIGNEYERKMKEKGRQI